MRLSWLISERGVVAALPALAFAAREPEAARAAAVQRLAAYSSAPLPVTEGGVAIVQVSGTLGSERDPRFYYADLTYGAVVERVARAQASDSVAATLVHFNTPGGGVTGCREACERLFRLSRRGGGAKPIWGFADMADSAGYWMGSSVDRLVVDATGEVGSIGVIMTHIGLVKLLEEFGVKVTHIFSGARKADGSPFLPLGEEAEARFQGEVDALRRSFAEAVARNRDLPLEAVLKTEANSFLGEAAVAAGLADAVGHFDDVLAELAAHARNPSMEGSMTTQTPAAPAPAPAPAATAAPAPPPAPSPQPAPAPAAHPAPAPQPAADPVAAERARINAILTAPEAAGREALARHLATATAIDAETAIATLAAAPKASGGLAVAMAEVPNPSIQPGGAAETGNEDVGAAAARIAGFVNVSKRS